MGPPELARGGELPPDPDRQRTDRGDQDRVVVEPGARRLEGFDGPAGQVDEEPGPVADVADYPDGETVVAQVLDRVADDPRVGLEERLLPERREVRRIVGIDFQVPVRRAGEDQIGLDAAAPPRTRSPVTAARSRGCHR
jgi:hypothetical protein